MILKSVVLVFPLSLTLLPLSPFSLSLSSKKYALSSNAPSNVHNLDGSHPLPWSMPTWAFCDMMEKPGAITGHFCVYGKPYDVYWCHPKGSLGHFQMKDVTEVWVSIIIYLYAVDAQWGVQRLPHLLAIQLFISKGNMTPALHWFTGMGN